ncbi:MAG: hypothetical protein D6799_02560 [Bacteroidetes bacterium]|jgi:DNA repair protein RecO (recombination protein O)|nr:MAG: hypothetical protein D6799_02560 [Bacteroidota bacterium]
MQHLRTKAIILQKTPFKDFQYILKLYSEKYGLITANIELHHYIQPAHIQIPNLCDVQIVQNKYKKNTIKEIKPIYIYKNIFTHYSKNIIAQFIAEVLLKTIKEEEYTDQKIFQYIQDTLIQLDQSEQKTDVLFHLNFLNKYIKLSGHAPLNNYSSIYPYFDLKEGRFTNTPNPHSLSKEDSKCLHQFLFDNTSPLSAEIPVLSITHHLVKYMQYHLGLTELHTLTFLKETLLEHKP